MPQQAGGWVNSADVKPLPADGWVSAGGVKPASNPAPTQTPSAPAPRSWTDSVNDFVSELFVKQPIHPIDMVTGTAQAISHPIDTLKAMGAEQQKPFDAAKEAFHKGDIAEGLRHALLYLVPIVGPQMDEATDQIQHGETAKGLGGAIGSALQVALPEMARRTPAKVGPLNRPGPNPVEAGAIQFAKDNQIPVDASTATRSPWVASVQKVASDNMGGAGTAERFKAGQEAALASTGEQLAARANQGASGLAQTGESVGSGALKALDTVVGQRHAEATTAYDALREMERAAPQQIFATNPDGSGLRAVRMAVDLAPAKQALAPVLETLQKEHRIAGGLNGANARAMSALETIMAAPSNEALSVVDGALSDLKSYARQQGPGPVSLAVKALDAAVRKTATEAGPKVIAALEDGRKATIAKYAAEDVRDLLMSGTNGEPVRIFNRLTSRDDTAINALRQVKQQTPEVLPEIGRALLDDMMGDATAEGGFQHAQALASKWRKVGPETKQLLFPDKGHIQAIDQFFQFAKMAAENPNPSGTARALNATKVTLALPAWAISKLLYTPTGVKLLTKGLSVPAHAGGAAAALSAQMMKVATQNRALALNPALAATAPPLETTVKR